MRDVVAAPSSICFIDGEKGILVYGGYDIHQLAENSNFEEVVFLLWNGRLPNKVELDDLTKQLVANRALPAEIISLIKSFPKTAVPMDSLRTAVSALSFFDSDKGNNSPEARKRQAICLTAQVATVVAAIDRGAIGREGIRRRRAAVFG